RVREGQKRDSARKFRRNSTDAERAIWFLLRGRRFDDTKFRRQLPIGPYVVDFASIEHRIVVELDGSQHAGSASDTKRDAFLRSHGWRVLRFLNNDVLNHRDGVPQVVQQALTPTLSRKRERVR